MKERGIQIIHQAGEKNIEAVEAFYQEQNIEAEVFGFTNRLSEYIHKADFAIARSGASTLWELCASGSPALFIPYPYAANDHQYHNAKFLAEQNLAWIMREEDLKSDKVLAILDEDLETKSTQLQEITQQDGALEIARLLRSIK